VIVSLFLLILVAAYSIHKNAAIVPCSQLHLMFFYSQMLPSGSFWSSSNSFAFGITVKYAPAYRLFHCSMSLFWEPFSQVAPSPQSLQSIVPLSTDPFLFLSICLTYFSTLILTSTTPVGQDNKAGIATHNGL